MQRLLFLSSISCVPFASGCSDDCGPGGAPAVGLVAGNIDFQLVYGNLSSSQNNDCPDPQAPPGVVSLYIPGSQMNGGGLLTLCVPRPDRLEDGATLGTGVHVVDMTGEVDGCSYTLDTTRPLSGTAKASGLCDNGANKAGFALTIDGAVSLRRTCNMMTDTVAVTFDGTVAVAASAQ